MTITINIEPDKIDLWDMNDISEKAYRIGMEVGRKIMQKVLEKNDLEILSKADRERYENKGLRKTSIMTKCGNVEYRRRVYIDKSGEDRPHCVYLLDEKMKTEKIGKVEKNLCLEICSSVMDGTFRSCSRELKENSDVDLSTMGVWNIFQSVAEKGKNRIEKEQQLKEEKSSRGTVETKILYEEMDGVWPKLQGESRRMYGSSREMKVFVAYDGVLYKGGKNDPKSRRILDNKVAFGTFNGVDDFRAKKEAIIANTYKTDSIELRVINGDAANWTKMAGDKEIAVLDRFHRNKSIRRLLHDEEQIKQVYDLLNRKETDKLIDYLEALQNSLEDEEQRKDCTELYNYFNDNKDFLLSYYDRGLDIPETRLPGEIHHARLGSMESNIFTLIGNRMKGRRACWSIDGGNNMALMLCLYHTTGIWDICDEYELPPAVEEQVEEEDTGDILSANQIPLSVGSGYDGWAKASIYLGEKWLKELAKSGNLI